MSEFRTLSLAISFYRAACSLPLPRHLKERLVRASCSIALNLSEGRGKPTLRDQLRFFHVAMGSARECQTILVLADLESSMLWADIDKLSASLYRLITRAK